MTKLKVAVLEDSKLLLKDLINNLEKTLLVEVVAYATTSEDFIEKVKSKSPEALLMDIDLSGDSMSGLDIANLLKLPVLFVSGKTKEFFDGIEDLDMNSSITVSHISKPITEEKLKKILPKFIDEVRLKSNQKFITLNFGDKKNKIAIDNIVCICADKAKGAKSGNKEIFFTDRKPEILIDFSFMQMAEKGLSENKFIVIHKSDRVNVDKILSYNKKTHEIEVAVYKLAGQTELKKLDVSETYLKNLNL